MPASTAQHFADAISRMRPREIRRQAPDAQATAEDGSGSGEKMASYRLFLTQKLIEELPKNGPGNNSLHRRILLSADRNHAGGSGPHRQEFAFGQIALNGFVDHTALNLALRVALAALHQAFDAFEFRRREGRLDKGLDNSLGILRSVLRPRSEEHTSEL